MKRCSKCELILDLHNFYTDKNTKDGYRYCCKSCNINMTKKWNKENKEKKLQNNKKWNDSKLLGWKYGSLEEYNEIFVKQNGKCLICEKESDKKLHLDHCHVTNKVRGLLCFRCNIGIGYLMDNISILKNAIKYLEDNS